ncbi:hypothetical protein [Saccharothrix sp. NRRL B-16314]|uniref:hypothetical protein n=1 Tax=Saccharothrix sp. NRRL B-16314 TaxID=1463825 RepID=UPI00052406F5|nr:hypothetical protein [Saccharothrix sp. NRRL B-16314]
MAADSVEDPSWVWDLVARDEDVRRRALARHQASVKAAADALRWSNDVWARAGTPAPAEPRLAAEMDRARAAFRRHYGRTVMELTSPVWGADRELRERHAPFVLLYLDWEGRYPDDWGARASYLWSPWGRKQVLLRALEKGGVPETIRPRMTDLVTDVLRRPYRCKDWLYARLVRHIADDRFRERMRSLSEDPDPVVRRRAEFLLHVAEHPQPKVRQTTWGRWLDSAGER